MIFAAHSHRIQPRSGAVLIAVLVVISVLSLIGYQFFRLMNAEADASLASSKLVQTRQLADSGLHYMAYVLAYPEGSGCSDTQASAIIRIGAFYDDPGLDQPFLHMVPVLGDNPDAPPRGYFSILSPRYEMTDEAGTAPFRFGVEDECAKVNLNAILMIDPSGKLAKELLTNLFYNVTGSADSVVIANIINWARSESQWIDGGDTGFDLMPKGAPYESLEELLRVKGVTPRMLLGNDINKNGIIDAAEGSLSDAIDPGMQRFLTVYSRERNVDFQGTPRINVNIQPDTANNEKWSEVLQKLEQDLTNSLGDARMAKMIVAYRIYGPGNPGNFNFVPGNIDDFEIDYERADTAQPRRIDSIYDLIGAVIELPQPGGGQGMRPPPPIRYQGPWPANNSADLEKTLPILLERCSITNQIELPARVNINTASPELLMSFPGMTQAIVEDLLDHRPKGDGSDEGAPEIYRTPTWLLTRAGFPPAQVKLFEPYFTTRSQVYRMQSVGYYQLGGPSVRIEAVIDTNYGRPRFLYWRDLTELGRGFDWSLYPGAMPQ